MGSWLDRYFQVGVKGVASDGVGLEAQPVIDFGDGLSATSDPISGTITVTADASTATQGALFAALRTEAGTATPGQKLWLKGYSTPGDGGEGTFTVLDGGPFTDDGGTIAVPGGGTGSRCAKRDFSGPIDARWFGADSTGTVDSTAAIQKAIDIAEHEVFLAPGTYKIAASTSHTTPTPAFDLKVALFMRSGITLRGAGRELTTLLVTTSRTGDHVDIAAYGESLSKTGVRDLTIDAGSQHGVDICLALFACDHSLMERVKCTRSEVHGMGLWYGSENNIFRDCYVYDVADIASAGIGFGIFIFGLCHSNEVSGCIVDNPTAKGNAGVFLDSSETATDGGSCNYNVIRDCQINNYQIGVGVEGCSFNLVQGCTITNWRQNGMRVNLSQDVIAPRKNNLVNNVIDGANANDAQAAIELAGAFETVVSGNRVKNSGTNNGIRITPPDGSSLIAAPLRWVAGHGTWTAGDRVAGKAGTAGAFRLYTCITTGTGAVGGDGPTSTSSDITDGTAHWRFDINHPGVASRNVIVDNVIEQLTGSGIFIETGKQHTVRGNSLTDCSGTPGTDAPIRVQNTSITSIIDLPIDDVVISENKILGGSADSPGIYAIAQADTDPEGTITNVRCSHNAIRDIGSGYGILFSSPATGAILQDVASDHDDVYDSRGTPEMLGAVLLGNAGGTRLSAKITAVQNRVPSTDDVTVSGGVIQSRDGALPVEVTWDPGSLGTGASALKPDIPCHGAVVGDPVVVSHPYGDGADGLLSIATVQEPHYLRLFIVNLTSGTMATGSATWKLRVLRS